MAPDYNDGRWHGWNGGECPVHPKTEVQFIWEHDERTGTHTREAGEDKHGVSPGWSGAVKAFRVVKEYREPRELWHLLDHAGEVFDTFTDKDVAQYRANDCPGFTLVHYREVTHGEAQ